MSVGRLDLTANRWMTEPETVTVMDAISPGDSDQARFVGGCVRNAIQDREVDDIDIATRLTPPDTLNALGSASVKAIPTGFDHGTVTAVVEGKSFQITSLRKDVQTDGRRAVVQFTTDWKKDAARRDFRLNAIYADRSGALFDPYGGVSDALSGRVVFIGDPKTRLAEDGLRILRFYRFNAWYGVQMDEAGRAACEALAARLSTLAAERVWEEFRKLLRAPDPRHAVAMMHKGCVLDKIWPGAPDLDLFSNLVERDRKQGRLADPLLRAVAISGEDAGVVRDLCMRMKTSSAERNRMIAMVDAVKPRAGALSPGLSGLALARALYVLGPQIVADRVRLIEAREGGDAQPVLEALKDWNRPRMPVGGRDLMALNLPRGPRLGAQLARLEDAWIDSGFKLGREVLLSRVAETQAWD